MAFPGGRAEKEDENLIRTALREAQEGAARDCAQQLLAVAERNAQPFQVGLAQIWQHRGINVSLDER